MTDKILAGFCRKDMTPEGSTALGGFGDDPRRMSVGVLDPIFGTCIALTGTNEETVLLYSFDLLHANEEMTRRLRASASKATGVPEDHIMLSSTHTHSGPGISSPELPSIQRFYDLFEVLMTQAAVGAMADRAPAEMYIGDVYTEGLNFVRHYRMENGTYGGDNFGKWISPIVAHASEVDNQIQLVKLQREAKKDIVIMNWQAHPKMSGTASSVFGRAHRKHMSADFVGYARKHLEDMSGNLVIYFTGGAGNVNVDTRIAEEMPSIFPDELGKALADTALKGLEGMRKIQGGPVATRQRIVSAEIDHSDDHLVEIAQEVWKIWPEDPKEALRVAREKGFNSAYAARDVIGRSKMIGSRSMELDAVKVGDIAFATAPYEMFCVNGKYIKENSPFEKTIVMSCANGANSYLASEFAFQHGGYEVDSRKFPKGTAERMVENHVEMLKEMYK